ncbi:DUF3472 domain-containing protein [Marinilabiliaceae bacterium JC017]|nr:DUF3472 domain-containing protein [Marinilabiliaceae bacterium JC017]
MQHKTLETNIPISIGGNSWVVDNTTETGQLISENGLTNWTNSTSTIRTFFHIEKTGDINIAIRTKVSSGQSKIKITLGSSSKEVTINNSTFKIIPIGRFKITQPGYHYVDLQGLEKSATNFAEVSDILIGGKASTGDVNYVKDEFYWGRRGPSVHLSYIIPDDIKEIAWFYNEVKVPKDEDVIGTYYMANGFNEGYFGMQVNSPTERRILFSVWSPCQTDNPNDIPEEDRIKLLKKGDQVQTGKFGNEGSGGQSYRVYNWKSDITYKFLLKGEPSENNSTDYTAYFFNPDNQQWELIASFRRPKTTTYLTHPYSFLENFMTETGQTSRMGYYSNQWICDKNGNWHELTKAKFTADATARKKARLDYAGGSKGKSFFLKNCGFFSNRTTINLQLSREKNGNKPAIDFSKLE